MQLRLCCLRLLTTSLLLVASSTLRAAEIDCYVPQNLPQAVEVNRTCDEWNAAARAGRLHSAEGVPKPAGAAAIKARTNTFNACVKKETRAGVAKPKAIEICKDRLAL